MSSKHRVLRFVAPALAIFVLAGALAPTASAVAPHPTRFAVPDARTLEAARGRLVVARRTPVGEAPRLDLVQATRTSVEATIAALDADPDVVSVAADAPLTPQGWPADAPNDPYFPTVDTPPWPGYLDPWQRSLPVAGIPAAWQLSTGDPSVVVAVIDTGANFDVHPDLVGANVIGSYDVLTGTTDTSDPYGHGTSMLSIIGTQTDNGIGIAGIAPGASLLVVKVDDGAGNIFSSDVMKGIDWAVAHGADVINLSLGGNWDASMLATYQPTISAAWAAGVTLVAAAGNQGTTAKLYPASAAHVISVSSSDLRGGHSSFANRNDGVDVTICGQNVMAAEREGGYAIYDATSPATAEVAAVAALMKSVAPTATPDGIEAALETTASDAGTVGYDWSFGFGILDPAAAFAAVEAAPSASPPRRPDPIPPAPALRALPAWRTSTSIPLSWGATPGSAAVASYDVRYRGARWDGSFGSWVEWKAATQATGGTFAGATGTTYCFSVRARDADGVASAWTAAACTAVPLDDRSLARAGPWSAGAASAYYRSTYLRSFALGARLVRTRVVARRIAIVATTCPTCGTVRIYWGSTLLRTVRLASATTVHQRVLEVAAFTSGRIGTVTIRVVSRGRRVEVDGLAVRRS